jgi:hypothetical protein
MLPFCDAEIRTYRAIYQKYLVSVEMCARDGWKSAGPLV